MTPDRSNDGPAIDGAGQHISEAPYWQGADSETPLPLWHDLYLLYNFGQVKFGPDDVIVGHKLQCEPA